MNLRELSKGDLERRNQTNAGTDEIQAGSLQRIADAVETVAKGYAQLQADLDWYKKRYAAKKEEAEARQRTNNALRGQITKLKNQIAQLKGE